MAKRKYNPEDVERWVTVKGARIPIMKDGSFGVGEMEAMKGVGAEHAKKIKEAYEHYSNKVPEKQLNKIHQTSQELAQKIYDDDIGERKASELIKSAADKLKLKDYDFNVFYMDVKDRIKHLADPTIDDDAPTHVKSLKSWEEYADEGIAKQKAKQAKSSKPTSRNAKYDTSRAKKKK